MPLLAISAKELRLKSLMNALRFLPSRCVIVTNSLYWNPLILSFLGSVGRAEQINAAVPVGIIPKLLVFR